MMVYITNIAKGLLINKGGLNYGKRCRRIYYGLFKRDI